MFENDLGKCADPALQAKGASNKNEGITSEMSNLVQRYGLFNCREVQLLPPAFLLFLVCRDSLLAHAQVRTSLAGFT